MNSTDNNKKDFVKQFSSWITEDGLAVDIYSGIKDLYKAVSNKDQILAENAFNKTGMAFIKQLVLDRLGRFADNIMVEYSLVASTLDPDRPNTLQCCSFINSDKDDITGFKQAISERYSLCIEKVSTQIGYTIYQHPHFLYDIPTEKDSTVWEKHINARSKYILTKVSESDSLTNDILVPDNTKGSPYLSIEGKDLSVGVFPLTRSYPEMIRSAQDWTRKMENKHIETKSLKELQTILHQYCYNNISHRNNTIKSSYFISFPVFGALASNQLPQYKVGNGSPLQGIGACFIYFEPKKDANINDDELHEQVSKLVYYVGDVIRFISVNYLFNLGLQLQENARREAIKSAIAAIMSRNMSHNLGSHYLYYTKNHLERLANELSNEQSPDIRGAARVLGYTQARMDYLATIISNDKYPYGAVNFKSQIFDELTIDSFSKRHFSSVGKKYNRTVNFLLSNLIRSEDFTRPCIMSDGYDNPDALDLLNLQIKYSENGKHYQCFTGTNYVPDDGDDEEDYEGLVTMSSEENIKRTLSNIDIALPGGNMSCHAFFNVVENFIRNSAKYLREDFNHPNNEEKKELTTTIALNYADKDHKYINCFIYDDKQNATYYKLLTRTKDFEKKLAIAGLSFSSYGTKEPDVDSIRKMCPVIIDEIEKSSLQNKELLLREARNLSKSWNKKCLFEQIIDRLSSIRILDKSNVLDKENKGLKEMFFSAAWMRAYHFPEGKTYTDIIYEIQEQDDPIKKMNLIREYGLCPIMVLDEGDQLSVLSFKDLKTVYFKPVNFGISFTLPIFRKEAEVEISSDENQMIHNCLDTYADVAIADFTHDCPVNLKEIFTRILSKEVCVGKSATQVLHEILRQRFDSFDDYYLSFGGIAESSGIHNDAHQIKFDHHMKDHVVNKGGLESQIVYAYSDTVSGGNFTKTMNELFDAAITEDGKYKSEDDEYFCLKIKESALTKITLIDERLYDSMLKSETQLELSLKNIRVLDYVDTNEINDFTELFKGNSFKDNSNNSNFLSIHLGLVEKIIQSSEFINFVGEMSVEERAIKFMSLLRENFGGNNVFIAIHSGRGNFSAELEGPLAEYPFITMSSLESAFNNCKYQLSQLFYNTLYIGKGKINHHSSPEV